MEFLTFSENNRNQSKKKKKRGASSGKGGSNSGLPGIFGVEAQMSEAIDRVSEKKPTQAKVGPVERSTKRSQQKRVVEPESDEDESRSEAEDSNDDTNDYSDENGDRTSDSDDDNSQNESDSDLGDDALISLGVDPSEFHKARQFRNIKPKKSKKQRSLTSTTEGFFGPGFASALASILNTHVAAGTDPVLAHAPEHFEKLASIKRQQKQRKQQLKQIRVQRLNTHVILASNREKIWNETEKRLRLVATQGVAQLFNTVREIHRQQYVQKKEKKPLPELNKEIFFDLLKTSQPELTPFQKNLIQQQEQESKESSSSTDSSRKKSGKKSSKQKPQIWKALTDDLYQGGSMKNWDIEREQEKA